MSDATKKVVVLGAGMVGAAIARDLADDAGLRVDVADVRPESLERVAERARGWRFAPTSATPRRCGGSSPATTSWWGPSPASSASQTVRTVDRGRPRRRRHQLHARERPRARRPRPRARGDRGRGLPAWRPGSRNLMAGFGGLQLDPCERIEIYVGRPAGGAPLALRLQGRLRPLGRARGVHAARADRGARPGRREGAALRSRAPRLPRASGPSRRFNTDGLRSLAHTLQAPFMKEKTLRWPGHAELMRVLRDTGFFSSSRSRWTGRRCGRGT